MLNVARAETSGPGRAREVRDGEGKLVAVLHRRSKAVVVQRVNPWTLAEVGDPTTTGTMAAAARELGEDLGLDGRDDYVNVADELSVGIFEDEPALTMADLDPDVVLRARWWAEYHRMSWPPCTDLDLVLEDVRRLDRRQAEAHHWWRPR